jgi:hypothetical protein
MRAQRTTAPWFQSASANHRDQSAAEETTMAKDQKTTRDDFVESYREMLTLLTTHYERTGDLALKEVVERAQNRIGRA